MEEFKKSNVLPAKVFGQKLKEYMEEKYEYGVYETGKRVVEQLIDNSVTDTNNISC